MEAIYKLKTTELNKNFLETIKALFKEKDVIIRISEDIEETDFLSYHPANEKYILENMLAEPTKRFTGSEFQEFIKD